MKNTVALALVLVMSVAVQDAVALSCSNGSGEAACQTLKAIYQSVGGTSWAARCGWCNNYGSCPSGECTKSGTWYDPCGVSDVQKRWDGVECSGSNLKSLNLGFNNLVGNLPNLGPLGTTLQRLFLQDNALTNNNLAALNIHQLTGLVTLTMQNNQFSGGIPGNVLGMPNLANFLIFNNNLNAALPTSITCSGGCGLKTFRFNDNSIPGTLPAALASLTNLEGLYGYDNLMTGVLPDIFESPLDELQFVDLHNNNFVGPLPARLEPASGGKKPNFDLKDNPLDCLLPNQVQSWNHIVDLTNNAGFFCNAGTSIIIPANVIGTGPCVPVSLGQATPQRIAETETTTQVTITGSGFNRCLAGWVIKMDNVDQPLVGTPTSSGGTDTLIVTLTNPLVGTPANRQIAIFDTLGTRFSNLLTVTYYKTCDPACAAAPGNHIVGCDATSGECQCEIGFGPTTGPNYCDTETCPLPCNNGGTCVNQVCVCTGPWQGATCAEPFYECRTGTDPVTGNPNVPCCGNGVCATTTQDGSSGFGTCGCEQRDGTHQWIMPDCCTTTCPANCNGAQGTCNTATGVCTCAPGWAGTDCGTSVIECTPTDCDGHGDCDFGVGICRCNTGWGGPPPGNDCSICRPGFQQYTPPGASVICTRILSCGPTCTEGRGTCNTVTGSCECDKDPEGIPLFQGSQCEIVKCPNDCSGQGVCEQCVEESCDRASECNCNTGWAGDSCEKKVSGSDDAALAASLAAICIVGAAAGGLYALRRKKIADLKAKNTEMK